MITRRLSVLTLFTLLTAWVNAQSLLLTIQNGLSVKDYIDRGGNTLSFTDVHNLFTFRLNGKILYLQDAVISSDDTSYLFVFTGLISGRVIPDRTFSNGWRSRIVFLNISTDTIELENVVPFGETGDHIYLTSTGPWALARAKLFRPGLGPVGVILPDNAWEMGYGSIPLRNDLSVCAIARRISSEKAEWRRYKTVIYPGGMAEYHYWADEYTGEWQNGLRLMFREKWLYDLDSFNDTLFRREDLKWIRHDYIIGLQFGWNKEFYDWKSQKYRVDEFLEHGRELFGGYDVFGLWPTWPRLGVDERNQWDLFSDLPGGLESISHYSRRWKESGTKFFICYNPWDESTRSENPYTGMAELIRATDADGVVLDCHGSSSYALQHAADSIKSGVVMYSEGMAVIKDMPGIVAGRVHDAIYLPPPLNINKLIRPDFAIFRVCQVHDGRIRREASVAFFNGYGTELNTFAPAQLENMKEDLVYLGRTSRTLRENTSNFLSLDWTPLLATLRDSIWVNSWPLGDKTLYTVFSLIPEGFRGPLFEGVPSPDKHLVSLWHHENLEWHEVDGRSYIPVTTTSFNRYELDTRTEGNIDCIALLPVLLKTGLDGGILKVEADQGDLIRIWAGDPSYQNQQFVELKPGRHQLSLMDPPFNNRDGKYVVQLMDRDELLDETVVILKPGSPRLISESIKTPGAGKTPDGMVKVPAGSFPFHSENTDQFIPYPDITSPVITKVDAFYMDRFPVTNHQYLDFLQATKYAPSDAVNFLKHWKDGNIPAGLENHPVVYVCLEDAKAYCAWAGKRLPTEVEWQYAAQGSDDRTWPWGNEFDSTRCNNASGFTTAVDRFPDGQSPFGVWDMTGNVWQLTNDVYDNGTYYYVILKGGSYYRPISSWWYVKGGPQPNPWHQLLLLVSPSFDRNATVSFRCIRDIE